MPKVSRVAVFWNPANLVFQERQLKEARVACQKLGVQLQIVGVRAPGEFDRAFSAILRERAEALWILADPMFTSHATRIVDFAASHRLATVGGRREYVEAGVLPGYWPSYSDKLSRRSTWIL